MTIKLHLGVADLPYSHTENLGQVKKGPNQGKDYASTTGDVAVILEEKYGIMEHFWNAHLEEITKYLEDGIEGAFESLMMGAPPSPDPFAAGTTEVEKLFQTFLDSGEIEQMGVPGVPTKASLERRSLRFKKKKNPKSRPSFIDSGTYESSFRCWGESN